uniref:uncharacterized protein LOC101242335 isoform X3 n=1 Tax=Ciona intestinalis TaxID=7719 RepID=UPI000EF51210|nr:uncharacterized protein LOC101242335 isoform X3 [Ciona intestinalis]|eukprot:XP_018672076.2 uncharacterized protein LOC101242335 isoform X3 [Ciona intestinalis]
MPASNCCMPLCTYNFQFAKRQSKVKKKDQDTPFMSLFVISHPKFAKTPEEKIHRENLRKVVLQYRDPTKGDRIKNMLDRESASICERHFTSDCFEMSGPTNKKSLKLGSIPTLNLPHKTLERINSPKANRKSPTKRHLLPDKILRTSSKPLLTDSKRLPSTLKEIWVCYERCGVFIAEQYYSDQDLVPKIKFCVSHDLEYTCYVYGWRVELLNLPSICIKRNTLEHILNLLDAMQICTGTSENKNMENVEKVDNKLKFSLGTHCYKQKGLHKHPVLQRSCEDNSVSTRIEYCRSPFCTIVFKSNEKNTSNSTKRCNACVAHESQIQAHEPLTFKAHISDLIKEFSCDQPIQRCDI